MGALARMEGLVLRMAPIAVPVGIEQWDEPVLLGLGGVATGSKL